VTPKPELPTPPPAARRATRRRARVVQLLLLTVALFVTVVLGALGRFGSTVTALRARHAAGPSWSFPARVYSDGLSLAQGQSIPFDYFRAHLDARGYQVEKPPLTRPGTWAMVPGGVEIFLRGFREAPDPAGTGGPERVRLKVISGRITAVKRMGGLAGAPPPDLAHAPRLEPVLIQVLSDDERVRRTWVPLEHIPPALRNAVMASEDRRFMFHFGLDLRSNLRALVANMAAGGVRQGASTITQQLARGLFLGRERTWERKLSEATLAVGLELLLTKQQILEMYLNSIYWGQGDAGGVAGAAEAARWYFDTPIESLSVDQCAMLAGLIPAPNLYSPFRNPGAAMQRRNLVLHTMSELKMLSPEIAFAAALRPLGIRRGDPPPDRFPSYTGYVRDVLDARLPAGAAEHWGLGVFTALDLVWQSQAESLLAAGAASLERDQARGPTPLEAAFVAIEPSTGRVRAVVGGRSLESGGFNRATRARRQPGSALKPVVYATALDPDRSGPRFTPASTVSDLKRAFDTPEGPWSPRNDEAEYHSQVTLAKALAKSLNVATANLVQSVGPAEVARYGERFGLDHLKPVASIGLGTNEVTLLSLTDAYAVFPNGGVRRPASPVRAVVDARGRVLLNSPERAVHVLPQRTAHLMAGLLEDVVIFGVSAPLRTTYAFGRPVGGKTGTTNDYNDAWFVGFTPDVVAGVWVGYDQPRSLGHPAAEIALPLWAGIMKPLLAGFPAKEFEDDPGIEMAWIDPWTGGLATPRCPSVMRVPFFRGAAPTRPCTSLHLDGEAQSIAGVTMDAWRRSGIVVPSGNEPAPRR
jgi:penicillin-binding protein 1B